MRSGTASVCLAIATCVVVGGCGTASPRFTPRTMDSRTNEPTTHLLNGIASYYADEFHGRKTSNGEVYDMHELTAAHRTLPFNTRLKVTNLDTQQAVVVRINDRGPFKSDRVIDLSLEAAKQIGLITHGTAPVKLEILELGTSER